LLRGEQLHVDAIAAEIADCQHRLDPGDAAARDHDAEAADAARPGSPAHLGTSLAAARRRGIGAKTDAAAGKPKSRRLHGEHAVDGAAQTATSGAQLVFSVLM
jgi:hypothetical protein